MHVLNANFHQFDKGGWGVSEGEGVDDGVNLGVGVRIGIDESILCHSRLYAHSYSHLQMSRGNVSG